MADRPYIPLFAGMEVVRRSGSLTRFPVGSLLGNVPDTPPPEPTGAILAGVALRQGTGSAAHSVTMPTNQLGDVLLVFTVANVEATHSSTGYGAWTKVGLYEAPDGAGKITLSWALRTAVNPGLSVDVTIAGSTGKYNDIVMAVRPASGTLEVLTPTFATSVGNTPPSITTPEPDVDTGAFLATIVARRSSGPGNSTPWVFDAPDWTTGAVGTLNGISGYAVRDSVPSDTRTYTATVTPNSDAVTRVMSLVVPLVAP